MYRNEKACGRAITNSGLDRSRIFFTTKIPPGSMGYERTKRAIESSLREAGVEYFDLVLIHAPYGGKEDRLGSWRALVEAQKAGKTKSIGVSNYGIHHLNELEEYIQQGGGGAIDVGQYEIHPWCAREDIVEWLQTRNIVVEAYSPLAHGTRMGEAVLRELGKKYNKSPAQIMIRWCLQRGLVPLPKSATPSRIRENAQVFDFELDERDMKRLFTGENLMESGGHTVIRQASTEKSNVELINSLRSNFQTAQQLSSAETTTTPRYRAWTRETEDGLYIPAIDFAQRGLAEEKAQEAIDLVLKDLHVDSIDLLIVSFPGILFDAEDDSEEEVASDTGSEEPDDFDSMIRTWRVLEDLKEQGMISQLGVAEFGSERLARFLPHTKVKPSVDQINLKDCCVVPKSLILYAKSENIQLLTHNDCMDILPIGTTRELLGPGEKGAGILASSPDAADGIQGDVEPQWVVKYTAVVKDRGVVENKGYFALADMGTCVKAREE
ncbi:gamma-cysteine synthetase regulatory subunit [Aspergillus bombycis]|uniref:D-xylose reductase [NAD(P)H] n=1 Tax=Aspergillus bombycis TaxID=109264 RepID=A0A1F8A1G2_9EURO|nr:gamma-cysteine synthetase regulatory subunit [Aspergillus bombycis]OGM45279.1 gamma-cysteine synthetase regulatory subunit [Aspergillus bombycis]